MTIIPERPALEFLNKIGASDEREEITMPAIFYPGGPAGSPLSSSDGEKWILLVEDDPDIRVVLVDFLAEAGYPTKAVASGAAALEILKTGRPCLILTDYLMDDMNGKELRRQIRESLGTSAPPFVLLTGFPAANLKDISGAILTKPIDCERLLGVVAQHYSA